MRHARSLTNHAVRLLTRRRIRAVAVYGVLASVVVTLALPSAMLAQSNAGGRNEVFAGSTFESYLRYLQSLGKSDPYPISIRGFSPLEIDKMSAKDSTHPWAQRYSFQKQTRDPRTLTLDPVRPTVGLTVNSSYPFGGNDGVVWAGKGLTSVAQIGVAARWGPFSATLAPIAFRSQNADFDMADNGQVGRLRFNDAQYPFVMDRPQRFGESAYSRVDLGESTLRADVLWLAAGISTASQWWGPANDYPYVLGNNSGGFPHVFFGTSKPVDAAIVRLHGRVVYGMLDQSPYSPVAGTDYFSSFVQPGKRRFMAGAVGLITIPGAPGLEIGGTRFFHAANSEDGITSHNLGLPFQNLLRNKLREEADTIFGGSKSVRENQLASLFFRWAPPGSGFDVYGEYGREDFSADMRDLLLEPEHSATTSLGVRKAWMTGLNLNAVRLEGFSYEASAGSRTRGEGQIYIHGVLLQGHTNRGQALGAPTGAGSGSAQTVAYDRFTPMGRMSGFFSRVTQREQAGFMRGANEPIKHAVDVMNSIGGEFSRFVGPFDIGARLVLTKDINRNFQADKSNVTLGFNVRQEF
jgi:hypothetical protein